MKISPLQFSHAIQQAIIYRAAGMSQIEAVSQACRAVEIPPDWAMIVQLTLDGSSALAANWAERIYIDSLDRARENQGAFK